MFVHLNERMVLPQSSPSRFVLIAATAVLLLVGYSLGSSSSGILSCIEDWIHNVGVTLYTLCTVLYLSVRFYHDGHRKRSPKTPPTKNVSDEDDETTMPSLRMSSTLTIEEENEPLPNAPIDLTGAYKVVENDNFGAFLQAQGLPWFLCNAASKARPTHTFEHSNYRDLTIHIQGIIESQTAYRIDGPHTETQIRGRVFRDSVEYLYCSFGKNCVGIRTQKIAVGEGYHVEVQRRFVRAGETWIPPEGHATYDLDVPSDKDRLIMMNEVVFDDDSTKESVKASQLFHRVD